MVLEETLQKYEVVGFFSVKKCSKSDVRSLGSQMPFHYFILLPSKLLSW